MAGVYVIQNTTNRKVYVGSSNDVRGRWRAHTVLLNRGAHKNAHLQASWKKHGPDVFRFWVAEECPVSELRKREQWWLDAFEPWRRDRGYNLVPSAKDTTGLVHTAEAKAKMGAAARGRTASPETRAKLSAARLGVKKSAEMRARLSATRRRQEAERRA